MLGSKVTMAVAHSYDVISKANTFGIRNTFRIRVNSVLRVLPQTRISH